MLYRIEFYAAGETAAGDYFAPHPYGFCSPVAALEIGEKLCQRWCFDGYRVLDSNGRELGQDDIEPTAHVRAYRQHVYDSLDPEIPW